MDIRKSRRGDLSALLEIYAAAREFMKRNANPRQWGEDRPGREIVERDIELGASYMIEERGEPVGAFALLFGEDPTYRVIEGAWLNDAPYATVHRVAGNGRAHGILHACLEFCEAKAGNIRIDTHAENTVMLHLLEKYGYTRCGTIRIADGSLRIAYQKRILR